MRIGVLAVGGRLDRYVARLFVLSYLAAFFLVVGLFLIMDMAVNLDEYMRPEESGEAPSALMVARYYALQLPFLYLQMSPYVTLVAGMFTAAKLTRYNEVVAALAAGVSVRRLIAPIFLGAGLLAAGMFALREWATEELGARRDVLLDRLRERRPVPVYEDFWVRDRQRRLVRVTEYRPAGLDGGQPEIRKLGVLFDAGAARQVAIVADVATPLSDGRWALVGGYRRQTDVQAQPMVPIDVLEEVRFTPADVELAWKGREHPMELSFSESWALLQRDPTNVQYRTLFHYHLTFPLAGLVLLAVGLPFVVQHERGKAGERIAMGFFLCAVYFGGEFVARTLGLQGQLGPLHAGWLPVLAFGALGAVLLGSMRS